MLDAAATGKQDYRQRLIQKFCRTVDGDKNVVKGQRHPVEPLSHAGFEYLHEPFDVAEPKRLPQEPTAQHFSLCNAGAASSGVAMSALVITLTPAHWL
eukprot:scaffold205503_cov16-Tisochrysis_lutea.AAC.1